VRIGLTPAAASLQADLADKRPAAAALLKVAEPPLLDTTLFTANNGLFVHQVTASS